MSIQYIRDHYGLPAKVRGRIRFDGQDGVITGARDSYLLIRLAGADQPVPVHPTWRMQYLPAQASQP